MTGLSAAQAVGLDYQQQKQRYGVFIIYLILHRIRLTKAPLGGKNAK